MVPTAAAECGGHDMMEGWGRDPCLSNVESLESPRADMLSRTLNRITDFNKLNSSVYGNSIRPTNVIFRISIFRLTVFEVYCGLTAASSSRVCTCKRHLISTQGKETHLLKNDPIRDFRKNKIRDFFKEQIYF